MKQLRNILLGALLGVPALALAQAVPDPVQYAMAPETPGPGEQVLIEAGGVGSLLGNAQITWTNNGTIAAQGAGLTKYTFTTGALGSHTTIGVTIASDQGTFTHTFSFSPSLLNLVWEANTTVPPFFKGKALYSAGSSLKVVALPVVYSGTSRIAASALSYQWTLNGDPQQGASGLGHSSFSFVGSQLNNAEDVSVDAYYGATKVAHGEVVVPATNPQLVFYQRDPLRGLLLDLAFPNSVVLQGQELTVQAVPYYFSRSDSASGQLSYSWLLNGNDATGPDANQGILTLRQTGAGQGSAQITATLQDTNTNAFVQSANAALILLFGAQSSGAASFGIWKNYLSYWCLYSQALG